MSHESTQSLRDWSDESIRASYPPARIVKNKSFENSQDLRTLAFSR